MSRKSHDGGSWPRRKNLFSLSALSSISTDSEKEGKSQNTLKKPPAHNRRVSHGSSSIISDASNHTDGDDSARSLQSHGSSTSRRISNSSKGNGKLAPYMFDSLRALRLSSDNDPVAVDESEPLSAVSTNASSFYFTDGAMDGQTTAKTVLQHGEVQTSAGMFRKKKEYLVLTDNHVLRYKSQIRAAEAFKNIPTPSTGRSPNIRHNTMPSISSQSSTSDLQTLSDSSGDKHGRIPLRQVVAVHRLDDGKPYFAIEICYLDEESGQASAMTLQFGNPEERNSWLESIRTAVHQPRIQDLASLSSGNLEHAARIVERAHDYDPANCAVYKIVQKHGSGKMTSRSSSDDLTKVASVVGFLAIGIHKVHFVQLAKSSTRNSSASLVLNTSQESYGILTLCGLRVSSADDTFELVFRQPLQKPKHLFLAACTSREIAARLYQTEHFLRPECGHRFLRVAVPDSVERLFQTDHASEAEEELCGLVRTLSAYCVAYNVNASNVRYTVDYACEDAPCFQLLPPADPRRPNYSPLELLAILRALRYNESFGSISFSGIQLDDLNGLHDKYGFEYVCAHTKRGTSLRLSAHELTRACLLVQEIRALAATSKKLRRMDFTSCISRPGPLSTNVIDEDTNKIPDIGCGVVEALFPLCRHQTTNVDWICLSGIYLSETDLDYLVSAAVDKSCHFRSIALNRCGLDDRSLGLILDALRAQENTLEAVEIAGNAARINPGPFDGQLGVFGFVRKLDLSNISRTSGSEPLLTAETLLIWRLQELRLSGTALNPSTVDALATYLAAGQSSSLHELHLDNTYLSGNDVAVLLRSLCEGHPEGRELWLDISQNNLSKDLDRVSAAIGEGCAPTHLSMRAVEYLEESLFRKMVSALTTNKTIRFLDMSQTALPGDASDETCRLLEKFLANNDTILELDLSGEDSRLATSKFGAGLNQALGGLKQNRALQCLRIERQRLGLQGASTLAEVLKENATLRELHCDNNEIPLQGLTDLVNSLIENTTLVYLPTMADGRAAAFRSAEVTMKGMSEMDSPPTSPHAKHSPLSGSSAVKRGIATVRRTAARSSSTYTPSFPALPTNFRSTSSPDTRPTHMTFTAPLARSRTSAHPATVSTSFTVQDIRTTQRLLTEQWDRQCFRLSQYLQRNRCILNEVPVNMEIEDEKFERPESAGSLSKMLEQVKYDTTPRAEKSLYFDSPLAVPVIDELNPGTNNSNVTLRQYHLDEGSIFVDSSVDDDYGAALQ